MPGAKRRPPLVRTKLQAVSHALQGIAPLQIAQSWDNVGVLAGDLTAVVRRILLCIDLTPEVVDEAVAEGVQLVVAYHPPIFKPVSRLVLPGDGLEAQVQRCIAKGIAIYATHTALDAADGGTNDVIARLCGIKDTAPLEHFESAPSECKIVVFVPVKESERVAEAMFAVGAGRIGDYEKCSFRIPGTGTFFGTESTSPVVGQAGRLERVEEVRLEAVCPAGRVSQVVEAIRRAHPYEEPAFDIYPLRSAPQRGIGRLGRLPRAIALRDLARKLKRSLPAPLTTVVGDAARRLRRAIIVVGAAGSLPFKMPLDRGDVIITGEIRHHDALTIQRLGCSAIALSHWASERPVLASFAANLRAALPGVEVLVSRKDRDPFRGT